MMKNVVKNIMDFLGLLRLYRNLRRRFRWAKDGVKIRPTIKVTKKVFVGTDYGGYYVESSGLSSNSIVYDLGVGEDISFAKGCIERWGCMVYAFDPTPRVAEFVRNQTLSQRFHFESWAIADYDGMLSLYFPKIEEHVSLSVKNNITSSDESISVPCYTVKQLMAKYGHAVIDILKISIEGMECNVLKNILADNIYPKQILFLQHYDRKTDGKNELMETIDLLQNYGYKVFAIAANGKISLLRI